MLLILCYVGCGEATTELPSESTGASLAPNTPTTAAAATTTTSTTTTDPTGEKANSSSLLKSLGDLSSRFSQTIIKRLLVNS